MTIALGMQLAITVITRVSVPTAISARIENIDISNSCASARIRLASAAAQRRSIRTLRLSAQPNHCADRDGPARLRKTPGGFLIDNRSRSQSRKSRGGNSGSDFPRLLTAPARRQAEPSRKTSARCRCGSAPATAQHAGRDPDNGAFQARVRGCALRPPATP